MSETGDFEYQAFYFHLPDDDPMAYSRSRTPDRESARAAARNHVVAALDKVREQKSSSSELEAAEVRRVRAMYPLPEGVHVSQVSDTRKGLLNNYSVTVVGAPGLAEALVSVLGSASLSREIHFTSVEKPADYFANHEGGWFPGVESDQWENDAIYLDHAWALAKSKTAEEFAGDDDIVVGLYDDFDGHGNEQLDGTHLAIDGALSEEIWRVVGYGRSDVIPFDQVNKIGRARLRSIDSIAAEMSPEAAQKMMIAVLDEGGDPRAPRHVSGRASPTSKFPEVSGNVLELDADGYESMSVQMNNPDEISFAKTKRVIFDMLVPREGMVENEKMLAFYDWHTTFPGQGRGVSGYYQIGVGIRNDGTAYAYSVWRNRNTGQEIYNFMGNMDFNTWIRCWTEFIEIDDSHVKITSQVGMSDGSILGAGEIHLTEDDSIRLLNENTGYGPRGNFAVAGNHGKAFFDNAIHPFNQNLHSFILSN